MAEDDVLPMVSFKTYPNQKPWIDGSLVRKLNETDAAYKHGKLTGDNCMVKQYKCNLCRSIKMARPKYRDKMEEQFIGLDMRRMWQRPVVKRVPNCHT